MEGGETGEFFFQVRQGDGHIFSKKGVPWRVVIETCARVTTVFTTPIMVGGEDL